MSDRPLRARPYALTLALAGAVLLGAGLRLVYPADIEYKGDERYAFEAALAVLHGGPWPLLGMSSGVNLDNPGLSVWAFVVLAKLGGALTPVDLARAVQVSNVLALVLLAVFVERAVPREEREPWRWGLVLACVSPFDVLLQRKIWAPSLFSLLSLAVLAGWWFRRHRRGAFAWGLGGALLGQLEMGGGFFLALAYVLGTLVATRGRGVRWGAWAAGSILGVVPLLPWLAYVRATLEHGFPRAPPGFFLAFSLAKHPLSAWTDRIPGQFFWVWIKGVAGFGLDYGYWNDVWRFLRSPFSGSQPTYAAAACMTLSAFGVLGILVRFVFLGLWRWNRARASGPWSFATAPGGSSTRSPTGLAVTIAFFLFGVLFTLSPFFFHRHYLLVAFPFQGVWLARLAWPELRATGAVAATRATGVARVLLGSVALGVLGTSLCLLADVHAHGGIPTGDFGVSYGAPRGRTRAP